MMMPDEGKAFNRWMVNGQMWPNVDPYVVKTGGRYRIAYTTEWKTAIRCTFIGTVLSW
jgi:hypothetical protein